MGKNIVVIGASVAGLSAAVRIRRLSESVSITVIEKNAKCGYKLQGLPYFTSNKLTKKESLYYQKEDFYESVYNISIYTGYEATGVDRTSKIVFCENVSTGAKLEFSYDELVLATGFSYTVPIISGQKCKNVFVVRDISSAIKVKEYYREAGATKVAIVGNNVIGFEIAKAMFEKGFEVSLISLGSLTKDLSNDFNFFLENELRKIGLAVYGNARISRFIQKRKGGVSGIKFEDGYEIETQFVIMCYNPVPNISFARKINLEIGSNRGIKVDSLFTTSDPSIKAIGSVSESLNPLTGKYEIRDSLRSAYLDGRCVADIIVRGEENKSKNAFFTRIYKFQNVIAGITGLFYRNFDESSHDIFSITIRSGMSERFFSDSSFVMMKIAVETGTNKIIRAEVAGKGEGVQRRLDILHTAIVGGLSLDDLSNLDISYTVDSGMNADPINVIGMIGMNITRGITNFIDKQDMNISDNMFIIDFRTKKDIEKFHTTNTIFMNIQDLRKNIDTLPKDKIIYVISHRGKTGYIAERILKGNGFSEVYNVFCGFQSVAINK